jgi:hypothetical protein
MPVSVNSCKFWYRKIIVAKFEVLAAVLLWIHAVWVVAPC